MLGGLLAASGVEILVERFQALPVNMRVLLGRGDCRVSEHFLHATQFGAPSQQVGRETVPQCVWAHLGM